MDDLLESHTWENRLLLVFSPHRNYPELVAQNKILAQNRAGLADRDLLVLQMSPGEVIRIDNNPLTQSNSDRIYRDFSIDRDAFALLLIGKDGTVKLTRSRAVTMEVVFDLIDAMPMRQLEMQTEGTSTQQD